MGTGVEQVGALAYHGTMDAPAHQSLGWHLWQVPTTQKATRVRVTTASFDERMSNIEFHTNDVNGTGAYREGVASGRCPVDQQRRPGCHPATAEQQQKRLGWSKEDNKRLFECYIRSEGTEKDC